jgi:hypothetical protein
LTTSNKNAGDAEFGDAVAVAVDFHVKLTRDFH